MKTLTHGLLRELGHITVLWSEIEQRIILHTSAMAAQETGGWPREYLRMDFKRLREKWFGETRKRFSKAVVDKVINPLNMELAEASNWRGYFLHGVWNADPKGGFVLSWWEQKTDLKRYEMRLKIEDVLTFRLALENLMAQLCELT